METTNKYHMSFEEAQEYISKRGLDIPWNDGDVFIDEREIMRTVGNVLKWADESMIERFAEWLLIHIDIPYGGRMIDGQPEAGDYAEWALERLKYAETIVDQFRQYMEK